MSYKYEYLKHKIDYLEFKNDKMLNIEPLNAKTLVGGSNNLIIHISGASGSGKTTLGNKLKDKFGDKIVVKDIDDLRHEFVKHEYGGYNKLKFKKSDKWNKKGFQQWIDNFISDQNKPIILVGLNTYWWWNDNLYYDTHSRYNFYIRLDGDAIFKQKCERFLNTLVAEKDDIVREIMADEKDMIKVLQNDVKIECGYADTLKRNKILEKAFKKLGYKFMSREDIYEEVSRIIEVL